MNIYKLQFFKWSLKDGSLVSLIPESLQTSLALAMPESEVMLFSFPVNSSLRLLFFKNTYSYAADLKLLRQTFLTLIAWTFAVYLNSSFFNFCEKKMSLALQQKYA